MTEPGRNLYIDRLRGAAIILVIVGHSFRFGAFWSDNLPSWMLPYFVEGAYFGVTIFFVISGYLITSKFLDTGSDDLIVRPRIFYAQRIGRILPPLLCLIVFSLGYKLLHHTEFSAKAIGLSLYFFMTLDFNALKFSMPNIDSSIDVLWSLSVEEAFYVLLPILCLAFRTRQRLAKLLCCVMVFGLVSRFLGANLYLYSTTFDQISIGALTAILAPGLRSRLPDPWRSYTRYAGVLLIIAAYFSLDPSDPPAITLLALLASAIIVSSPTSPVRSGFMARWLERVGTLSYELYLTHMVVLWATKNQAFDWRGTGWLNLQNWGIFAARLAVMYGTALIMQKLVSSPCNKLIRRWLIGDPRRAQGSGFPVAGLSRRPL